MEAGSGRFFEPALRHLERKPGGAVKGGDRRLIVLLGDVPVRMDGPVREGFRDDVPYGARPIELDEGRGMIGHKINLR